MGLRRFLFGDNEEQEPEYENDHSFEGVPTGKEVREQGAPSMFGNYSDYPGGYAQAVKDWRNGDYCNDTSGSIDDDDTDDDEPEPEREEKRSFWHLW